MHKNPQRKQHLKQLAGIVLVTLAILATAVLVELDLDRSLTGPAFRSGTEPASTQRPQQTIPALGETQTLYLPTITSSPRSQAVAPGEEAATVSVEIEIVGPEEIVFDWSEDACSPEHSPDLPVRAFRDAQGRVQLTISRYINRRMIGPDLDHLSPECDITLSSDSDPDPANFNDREWISAVYTTGGDTVFALVHNEHQGNRHDGQCLSGLYQLCWYNTITLAISTDGGDSYTHAAPPTHLVASIPYPYVPDAGPVGIFSPSNILYNPSDGYYYVLAQLEQYQDQAWGTCVMRTSDLADPTAWQAWDGSGFTVRFANPYGEVDNPQDHLCQPVSRDEIRKMSSSITFNTYLNRFLLVGSASRRDSQGKERWGFYYSLSYDLIHWTPRQLLMEAEMLWTYECGDANPLAYPALLDSDSPSSNFETTGKRFYLYFTRFNSEACRLTNDRDLIRVPIELFK
jgi:hypothetical protein